MSSGVPSAGKCIWEWKRSIFLTNNPGLEWQFSELSLCSVQQRIQHWLDQQGRYPANGAPDEYGFYIEECFPIADDRRAYFQEKVRSAHPHVGYRLLCALAQSGLVDTVWTTNFDGLVARAAYGTDLTPVEVGIDSQHRLSRPATPGELRCVSIHGDYRYDKLKNTDAELQRQERELSAAFVEHLTDTPLIVCGYSGRDASVMQTLETAVSGQGAGAFYWCGFSDGDVPPHVASLINLARQHGRKAYYVPIQGFDDLVTRLALHCLEGEPLGAARGVISDLAPDKLKARKPFEIPKHRAGKLIKSNAFEIECPSELLEFGLKQWPDQKVWAWVREKVRDHELVAVPHRGKILAFGTVDTIKQVFGENVKGTIDRTPIAPQDLRFEDGAVVSLLRRALTQALAAAANVSSDGEEELWDTKANRKEHCDRVQYHCYESIRLTLRSVGLKQYLVLMPSIKVLTHEGENAPTEAAKLIRQRILGYQHNKPFNGAVNNWRKRLFDGKKPAIFEFPANCGSSFRFTLSKAPICAEVGLPDGGPPLRLQDKHRKLVIHRGVELSEPQLIFSDKAGRQFVGDAHPIRGIVRNRPFDYSLTQSGLAQPVRLGVICPAPEAGRLSGYLQQAKRCHAPDSKKPDYLLDYPGFESAYGVPLELPEPGQRGWINCPEPKALDQHFQALEVAQHINSAIETLRASHMPNVILIYFPDRWSQFRGYSTKNEAFDVRDFVKAFCVQRGVATQFLNESTLVDQNQCRVWWWLSLAFYVKSMRTPWVLDGLQDDTAFVGLGFTIDRNAEPGRHVVLGCSHIYSARGEGLQYRLSQIEDPQIRRGNPFMSRDDARRTGETIRELFFHSRDTLPRRVVLHKRTPFLKEEREGLLDGLSGVHAVDMLEVMIDHSMRYLASEQLGGNIVEDNYPVRRGTVLKQDDYKALLWVHGATQAVNPRLKYFQGKRRIPAPLAIRRHVGATDLSQLATEILGLSKMNWNTFDLYTKFPATLQSSNEIARIGSLLQRFSGSAYDYRLFI
ncbi:MAG: SIR2 family protein [Pseudomonadota bacterium]